MYNRLIKTVFNSKKVAQNFTYLSMLQLVNVLLPFLTYPFLIETLGAGNFGMIIYAQMIVSYFSGVINFGFNTSAVKAIANYKGRPRQIEIIFSSVMYIKMILMFLCFLIYLLFLYILKIEEKEFLMYLFTFLFCVYEFLFPVWYFQGTQRMKFITMANFASKLCFTVLIFLLIDSNEDYYLVPAITGLGFIVASLYSLYIVFKTDNIVLKRISLHFCKRMILDGWVFFYSNMIVILKERTNGVLIANFLGYSEVAAYDLITKVITIIRVPFVMLRDSVYPNIVETKNYYFLKRLLIIITSVSLVIYLALISYGWVLVSFLSKGILTEYSHLFYHFGLILPLSIVTMFTGIYLVSEGKSKVFQKSLTYSALSFILMTFLLYYFNHITIIFLIWVYILSVLIEASIRLNAFKIHTS